MSRLSIVIPVYNRTELLRRALDSIVSQYLLPFETIIVDDASDVDMSYLERDEQYSALGLKVVRLCHNSGVSIARNEGIRYSNGDYIVFLDSDDWFKDSYVLRTILADIELLQYNIAFYPVNWISSRPLIRELSVRCLLKSSFGESLVVVNSSSMLRFQFNERIIGGEGLTWRKIVHYCGSGFLINRQLRNYSSDAPDRYSANNRKNNRRIFFIYLEEFKSLNMFIKYYTPRDVIVLILKLCFYSFKSLL